MTKSDDDDILVNLNEPAKDATGERIGFREYLAELEISARLKKWLIRHFTRPVKLLLRNLIPGVGIWLATWALGDAEDLAHLLTFVSLAAASVLIGTAFSAAAAATESTEGAWPAMRGLTAIGAWGFSIAPCFHADGMGWLMAITFATGAALGVACRRVGTYVAGLTRSKSLPKGLDDDPDDPDTIELNLKRGRA